LREVVRGGKLGTGGSTAKAAHVTHKNRLPRKTITISWSTVEVHKKTLDKQRLTRRGIETDTEGEPKPLFLASTSGERGISGKCLNRGQREKGLPKPWKKKKTFKGHAQTWGFEDRNE